MMARFPGLSRVDSFTPLDWHGATGKALLVGHGPASEPRIPYEPKPMMWQDALDKAWGSRARITDLGKWWNPQGNPPPTEQAPPNVLGASSPDLFVVRQANSGGGLSVGSIALLALLGVGGWFLYKKMKGAS